MKIMGFDHASSGQLGWGLIDSKDNYLDHGHFRSDVAYPKSMAYIIKRVNMLVNSIAPELMVFEDQKDNRGFTATQRLIEIKGALKVLCIQNSIPYLDIPPSTMKKIVTGNGWASKQEVAIAVAEKLNVPIDKIVSNVYFKQGTRRGQLRNVLYDSSDALGLAISWKAFLRARGGVLDYDGK